MPLPYKPSYDYLHEQYIVLGKNRYTIAEETGLSPSQIGSLLQQYGIRRYTIERHGLSTHPLHTIWQGMRERCCNPNAENYMWYGGRGIDVCDEWARFTPFYNWAIKHGWKTGLTIDRIDQNGDYSPNNCRFITHKEQCRNRRSNRTLTIDGVTHLQCEWEELVGLKPKILARWRHRRGEEYMIRRIKEALSIHAS